MHQFLAGCAKQDWISRFPQDQRPWSLLIVQGVQAQCDKLKATTGNSTSLMWIWTLNWRKSQLGFRIRRNMLRGINIRLPAIRIAVRPIAHTWHLFPFVEIAKLLQLGAQSVRSRQISTFVTFGGNEARGSHPEFPTSRSNILRPKDTPTISWPPGKHSMHAYWFGHRVTVTVFHATGSCFFAMSLGNASEVWMRCSAHPRILSNEATCMYKIAPIPGAPIS